MIKRDRYPLKIESVAGDGYNDFWFSRGHHPLQEFVAELALYDPVQFSNITAVDCPHQWWHVVPLPDWQGGSDLVYMPQPGPGRGTFPVTVWERPAATPFPPARP